ncbi:homoserine dehydrogenase [bacterium]|nr:homoserine dehydrogenase [bacterium]
MSRPEGVLRLGVAGLGTVGGGLIKLIERQGELRIPGRLEIAGVSARSKSRRRGVDISGYRWFDDPVELASADGVDVVVELIGGSDGPAKRTVETALRTGKHVVTANKALIAEHGMEIARAAEASGAALLFEAAVAGAIPIVRALRASLSGVRVSRVSGILNGTCNYILSEMLSSGAAYADVLAEAKRLGYAEADPTLDVSGADAAHKIVILAAIAFSAAPEFSRVSVEGVDAIQAMDIALAAKFNYRIKLLAEARETSGGIVCRVAPALTLHTHALAGVDGPLNAVVVEGDPVGRLTFSGPGAGAGPTAAAVMGDLARLFEGPPGAPFGRRTQDLSDRIVAAPADVDRGAFFLSMKLADRSGAFAGLTEALAEESVSIDKIIQDSAGDSGAAPVAIFTHDCTRAAVEKALRTVAKLGIAVDSPRLIRIEDARS